MCYFQKINIFKGFPFGEAVPADKRSLAEGTDEVMLLQYHH